MLVCNTSGCVGTTNAGSETADFCVYDPADFVLENESFVGDDEEMADFIETINTKTAVRVLATPIADAATFNSIISGVISDNPFECVDYTSNGQTVSGVTVSKQSYTAKFIYEDDDAKTVGSMSLKAPTVDSYNEVITQILANTALATEIGGDCIRDSEKDVFSCTIKCMDAGGELYYVTFSRNNVRVSSYNDDAILANVETWADSVAALA
ncbi:hypothetical protein J2128_002471 [Methanomicrobium sp. W14]|uniref:hypothetical protein n=1 Tax=Methanomicrobium sp. W14 TaxID=2817839 RepID=UPI0032AF7A1A|nr:hypothetical protein [Methanomicrobium sp. W14]